MIVEIKSVEDMVEEARRQLDNRSPEQVLSMVEAGEAVLLDIRDVRELQREGVVPGAIHTPRGMLEFWADPESTYFKPVFGEDRELVLY